MIRKRKLDIYCGWWRNTIVKQVVEDKGCGAGKTKCLECGGSGWWGRAALWMAGRKKHE